MGKGKKNKKDKAPKPGSVIAIPSAIIYNAAEDRTKSTRQPTLIPPDTFETIADIMLQTVPLQRNILLTMCEYRIRDINPMHKETSDSPTHMIIFCLRIVVSDQFHPLGCVQIDKRIDQTDKLVHVWKTFLQDLSILRLIVIGSISPPTATFHRILSKLTEVSDMENHTGAITYSVFPYKDIIHFYDYLYLLHKTQEAFFERNEICFMSCSPSETNTSPFQLLTASWTDILLVLISKGINCYYTSEDRNAAPLGIFFSEFLDIYQQAQKDGLMETDSKESTDRLMELFCQFTTLVHSEEHNIRPSDLQNFYDSNELLRILLATAQFKKLSLLTSSDKSPPKIFPKEHTKEMINSTFKYMDTPSLSGNYSFKTGSSMEICESQMENILGIIDDSINNHEMSCDRDANIKRHFDIFLQKVTFDDYDFFLRTSSKFTCTMSQPGEPVCTVFHDHDYYKTKGLKKAPTSKVTNSVIYNIVNDYFGTTIQQHKITSMTADIKGQKTALHDSKTKISDSIENKLVLDLKAPIGNQDTTVVQDIPIKIHLEPNIPDGPSNLRDSNSTTSRNLADGYQQHSRLKTKIGTSIDRTHKYPYKLRKKTAVHAGVLATKSKRRRLAHSRKDRDRKIKVKRLKVVESIPQIFESFSKWLSPDNKKHITKCSASPAGQIRNNTNITKISTPKKEVTSTNILPLVSCNISVCIPRNKKTDNLTAFVPKRTEVFSPADIDISTYNAQDNTEFKQATSVGTEVTSVMTEQSDTLDSRNSSGNYSSPPNSSCFSDYVVIDETGESDNSSYEKVNSVEVKNGQRILKKLTEIEKSDDSSLYDENDLLVNLIESILSSAIQDFSDILASYKHALKLPRNNNSEDLKHSFRLKNQNHLEKQVASSTFAFTVEPIKTCEYNKTDLHSSDSECSDSLTELLTSIDANSDAVQIPCKHILPKVPHIPLKHHLRKFSPDFLDSDSFSECKDYTVKEGSDNSPKGPRDIKSIYKCVDIQTDTVSQDWLIPPIHKSVELNQAKLEPELVYDALNYLDETIKGCIYDTTTKLKKGNFLGALKKQILDESTENQTVRNASSTKSNSDLFKEFEASCLEKITNYTSNAAVYENISRIFNSTRLKHLDEVAKEYVRNVQNLDVMFDGSEESMPDLEKRFFGSKSLNGNVDKGNTLELAAHREYRTNKGEETHKMHIEHNLFENRTINMEEVDFKSVKPTMEGPRYSKSRNEMAEISGGVSHINSLHQDNVKMQHTCESKKVLSCCVVSSTSCHSDSPSCEVDNNTCLPYYTRFKNSSNSTSSSASDIIPVCPKEAFLQDKNLNSRRRSKSPDGAPDDVFLCESLTVLDPVLDKPNKIIKTNDFTNYYKLLENDSADNPDNDFTINQDEWKKHAEHELKESAEFIDYKEYKRSLETCDIQESKCDIIYRDRKMYEMLYSQIPDDFETLRVTTDWLCTFKGYIKLKEILIARKVRQFEASTLSLEHIDFFVHLIKKGRNNRSSIYQGQRYMFLDYRCAFNLLSTGAGVYIISNDDNEYDE